MAVAMRWPEAAGGRQARGRQAVAGPGQDSRRAEAGLMWSHRAPWSGCGEALASAG